MACSTRGWLILIMLIFSTISAAAAEPKRVLLLHSFGPQFVPWAFFAGHFREELFKQSPDKRRQMKIDALQAWSGPPPEDTAAPATTGTTPAAPAPTPTK